MGAESKIKQIAPGWFLCREGLHLWTIKEKAEECCKNRHSREFKEVWTPQSKKPGAWV